MSNKENIDVCLILEGTYPYVTGGVSTWTHDLITHQSHLTFHIISILPRDEKPTLQYVLPPNVSGLTTIYLQKIPEGEMLEVAQMQKLFNALKQPLINITTRHAGFEDFRNMIDAVDSYHGKIGSDVLLDSVPSWNLLTAMYEASFSQCSMLDYFWSWRAVMGGLYSLITPELPVAKCYHALSTGYAGLLAARAKIETGKPVILTEHGIYTNERRIEISSADWLEETASKAMTIDQTRLDLRDLWSITFANYSRICYNACDHIITLFSDNQRAQMEDGANPDRMHIIPNGIDVEHFSTIERKQHTRPTIALIGRVVPIKDVKNFLRATAALNQSIPDLRAFIIGGADEDPAYFKECEAIVEYFALQKTVIFTGKVRIEEYLPEIDVLVMSSISEAQPLVILEAGSCGIPVVATNVGACREMVLGKEDESPHLGVGGVIVSPSNPKAMAEGILKLLTNGAFYNECSKALQNRVTKYYNKQDQYTAYRDLYAACGTNNRG